MLPQDFINQLKNLYTNDGDKILKTFDKSKPTTFRINHLHSGNVEKEVFEELKDLNIKFEKGPFNNSFYITKEGKIPLSYTKAFNEGKIYVQEFSSMIPPLVLEPKQDEYILDMTAAPGSKTTQMAELANNKVNIMAIEKSKIRYLKLNHNINLQKAKIKTKNENAIALNNKYPEFNNFFDKILLDAPCSSEGRFLSSKPKTYSFWNLKKVKEMQKQQKRLINKAIQMLKPGGILVYSTCTINTAENEEVINWLLKKNHSLKIEKIDLSIKNSMPGITKVNGKSLNKEIKKTIRIIPNELFSAFYIAKIVKKA